jgi:hypothetical protein
MNAPALIMKSETSMLTHANRLIEVDICHPMLEGLILLQAKANLSHTSLAILVKVQAEHCCAAAWKFAQILVAQFSKLLGSPPNWTGCF